MTWPVDIPVSFFYLSPTALDTTISKDDEDAGNLGPHRDEFLAQLGIANGYPCNLPSTLRK